MGPEAALNTHGHLNVEASGRALNRWDFRQSNGRSKVPSRRGAQGALASSWSLWPMDLPTRTPSRSLPSVAAQGKALERRGEVDAAGGKAWEE